MLDLSMIVQKNKKMLEVKLIELEARFKIIPVGRIPRLKYMNDLKETLSDLEYSTYEIIQTKFQQVMQILKARIKGAIGRIFASSDSNVDAFYKGFYQRGRKLTQTPLLEESSGSNIELQAV